MIVYHGTTDAVLDSVLDAGLLPQPALNGTAVWAMSEWSIAVHYAADMLRAGEPIVFEFDVGDDDRIGAIRCRREHVAVGPITPERLTVHRSPRCTCHDA